MKEDIKDIQTQLDKRAASKLRIEPLNDFKNSNLKNIFILSESDLGVVRNGGRRGAAFGPKAIVNTLLKMTTHKQKENGLKSIRSLQPYTPFTQQQSEDISSITEILKSYTYSHICHLGGGHDHIYPLLKALNTRTNKIAVINIDAHLDTRTDLETHSGTPFRQFANEVEGDFKLIQLGIHDFANEISNYTPLNKSEMEIYSVSQLRKETSNFTAVQAFMDKVTQDLCEFTIILSLDCDAISSQSMEAVSAVNHNGLELSFVRDIFSWYYSLDQKQKFCGIYEYNPIFDNLSNKGARALASLIEPFL
ncbi:arginase family protein [Halobacteriovorax sp. JY17]|uniref:arginase family protein n=1 Tax=Halobacteriovorax sp. JY17 TaxID=2014617 RepID=UPI000C458E90|nr:arginase family protein [Halobacteriovorax sp. JY17]PIK16116.1 MAG: hypothetical protein CES88_05120 [Halobacteriovorax sp. JY17]